MRAAAPFLSVITDPISQAQRIIKLRYYTPLFAYGSVRLGRNLNPQGPKSNLKFGRPYQIFY